MSAALANGGPSGRFGDGWHALAKLLFFCCGCESTQNFNLSQPLPGHFVEGSRFSKTSGRSFLTRKCRDDLLYVSDPCEHAMASKEDDLGIYRGVFRGFLKSKTRQCLIGRQVALDDRVRCPYCGARAWSMTTAGLVPKSAARRLGSRDGGLEYFVCLNGHLHGSCWLVPLSSDEDEDEDEDEDGDENDEVNGNGNESVECGSDEDSNSEINGCDFNDQIVANGRSSMRLLSSDDVIA